MAFARLDIPGLMLYGGSIRPGHYKGEDVTIQQVFEAVGAFASGKITEQELHELEEAASPGAGACGGQFTANTMAMAFEVLGISPAGSSMVPAEDGHKLRGRHRVRRTGHGCVAQRAASQRGHHQARPRERDRRRGNKRWLDQYRVAPASRRARNGRAAVDRRVRRYLRCTPLLCDLQPGGKYVATDLYEAGGVPLVHASPARSRRAATPTRLPSRAARSASTLSMRERNAGPTGRARARRPIEAHRRLCDSARQRGTRRVRGQAGRATSAAATTAERGCSTGRRRAMAAVLAHEI